MQPMKQRSVAEGVAHHGGNPVRVYEGDWAQGPRVQLSRKLIDHCLPETQDARIVELGCGTGDISGPFAEAYYVYGYDCHNKAIEKAQQRFPRGHWLPVDITTVEPYSCDILVMTEVLEHLPDPGALVKAWMPLAKYSIISHPLNEVLHSGLSGGDHQWSYDKSDLLAWFAMGDHQLATISEIKMGSYTIGLASGKHL